MEWFLNLHLYLQGLPVVLVHPHVQTRSHKVLVTLSTNVDTKLTERKSSCVLSSSFHSHLNRGRHLEGTVFLFPSTNEISCKCFCSSQSTILLLYLITPQSREGSFKVPLFDWWYSFICILQESSNRGLCMPCRLQRLPSATPVETCRDGCILWSSLCSEASDGSAIGNQPC